MAIAAHADTVTIRKPAPQAPGTIAPRSVDLSVTTTAIGAVVLFDGRDGLAGVAFHAYSLTDRLSINAITVTDPAGGQLYLGTLLTFKLYDKGGVSASVGFGAKGFDISHATFAKKRQALFSFQFNIPIGR